MIIVILLLSYVLNLTDSLISCRKSSCIFNINVRYNYLNQHDSNKIIIACLSGIWDKSKENLMNWQQLETIRK